MTGLLRTSIFFFLPVFGGLVVYHNWIAAPSADVERRQLLRERYDPVLERAKDVCESMLRDDLLGTHPLPEPLLDQGVLLAEVIAAETPLLRLVGPVLAESESWSMFPAEDGFPRWASGFLFSTPAGDIRAFSFEETVYRPDGNPARLNLFVREGSAGPR